MADLNLSNQNMDAYGAAAAPEAAMPEATTYEPTERDKKVVAEIDRKFSDWRRERANHEPQWFINNAFFRGNQGVSWSSIDNRLLAQPVIQPQRTRRQINRLFAKVRARRAKFLKNRATWVIVPATNDIKDKLDARATGKVLDYFWRKAHLEAKYRDAVICAEGHARGYWWFGWNPEAIGRVTQNDPQTGKKTIVEAVVGEVEVEFGSPFEMFVGDPTQSSLRTQDEIIRAKERTLDYVQQRFPERAHLVAAEGSGDTFQFAAQIANLNTTSGFFGGSSSDTTQHRRDQEGNPNTVVVKEYFRRPTSQLPKGKYCVIANSVLLKEVDEVPHGFYDFENPFPCVEFVDVQSAGQYWGTTVLEQMIDLQREYNGVRSMVSTNLKLMGHPKVFVAKQHQIPAGAWTPDAGEIIEYNARAGIPEPKPWLPPNVAGDAWRIIELLRTEFDDISQVYPASEGRTGGATSGFQTNLLQEATDSVHTPDVRGMELSIEEAAFKIRRIMRRGYTIPRLITVTSSAYTPEVFEFSSEEVDEYADIVVQAGSALPMLKGARIQAALDLYARGVLGDPADPEVRRRVLNVLDLGGMDDVYDYQRIDEDMINIENSMAEDGQPLSDPRFFENHEAHWRGHINRLKAPAVLQWPSEYRMELLAHAIKTAKYINHAAAYQMSIEAGMEGLIPPPMVMTAPPGMAPTPEPTPSTSFNESAPPQGGPTPPLAGGANPNNNPT